MTPHVRWKERGQGGWDATVGLPVLGPALGEWSRDALCLEYPEVSWFAGGTTMANRARDICSRCLVRDECLGYALENRVAEGIWGGERVRNGRVRDRRQGVA